jgi:hypothetical protein
LRFRADVLHPDPCGNARAGQGTRDIEGQDPPYQGNGRGFVSPLLQQGFECVVRQFAPDKRGKRRRGKIGEIIRLAQAVFDPAFAPACRLAQALKALEPRAWIEGLQFAFRHMWCPRAIPPDGEERQNNLTVLFCPIMAKIQLN